MGTWLNNGGRPYLLNWGNLRRSLDMLEYKMEDMDGHYQLMIPTWRYKHAQFPSTFIHQFGRQEEPLVMKTGFRYSMDIPLVDGRERWTVEHMIQQAFKDPRFLDHGGNKVTFNSASRRSFGHQGKQDPIEACTYVHDFM